MAVIFYLSGTGNSLYAAKSIAQELEQCRMEGITGYLKAPYEVQDEVVGIVCPVYCMAAACSGGFSAAGENGASVYLFSSDYGRDVRTGAGSGERAFKAA